MNPLYGSTFPFCIRQSEIIKLFHPAYFCRSFFTHALTSVSGNGCSANNVLITKCLANSGNSLEKLGEILGNSRIHPHFLHRQISVVQRGRKLFVDGPVRGHVHIHVATHNVELTFSPVPTHAPEITSTVAVTFYVSIRLLLHCHAIYIIFSHLVLYIHENLPTHS